MTDRPTSPTSALPPGDFTRRQLLGAVLAVPLTAPILAAARRAPAASPIDASSFVVAAPSRLADTRPAYGVGGYTRLDATTIRVTIAGRGGVPADAVAAVLNVTATETGLPSFVTVYPAGSARPFTSNINVERARQNVANLVTVRLGVEGAVDVYTLQPLDVIVDVNGAYVRAAGPVAGGRFVGLDSAARVLDTRVRNVPVAAGGVERVDLRDVLPASATAVVVNLTVTETAAAGFWTGYAAGGAPARSSSVNTDAGGQTRANQAILPIGSASGVRGIDVFSSTGGHLVVDVAGWFTGPADPVASDGRFVPTAPTRVLDTRLVPAYGRMYAGWVAEFAYDGLAGSQAVAVNLTATETRGAGFFTAYPARTVRPLASNLNAIDADQTIANHAIVRASTSGIALFAQTGGQVIADVAGYYTGTPTASVTAAPVNVVPPPPPSPLPWVLSVPALGVEQYVLEGVGANIVDAGYAGHWPGTSLAGEDGHIVLFAHRTEHGGLFRSINLLGPGDEVNITGADGRTFRYTWDRRQLTGAANDAIFGAAIAGPAPSVSLVACSRTNFQPTDVRYRIVVTFVLAG